LFRLVSGRVVAAALALILMISPANLSELLSLRDYSKAPFVLAAVLILAVLILRPWPLASRLGLAALYGAIVAIGYGFRGDLAVMIPFGAAVVLIFVSQPIAEPSSLVSRAARNALASAALLAGFLIVGWPVLSGVRKDGGCQYHFALLGLTTPMTTALHLT